jgi:hypothetical protein
MRAPTERVGAALRARGSPILIPFRRFAEGKARAVRAHFFGSKKKPGGAGLL